MVRRWILFIGGAALTVGCSAEQPVPAEFEATAPLYANMAHIHCGRFGENGPIRMWLHPVIGTSGAANPSGLSAEGVVCPAANVGTNMPLLDAIRAGLTYVNVHINDGVPPTNTGPGDFPGGEIRGQIDQDKGAANCALTGTPNTTEHHDHCAQ